MKYLYYNLSNRRITVTVTGTWQLPSPILKYFHSIKKTKEHNNKSNSLHTCQSKYEPSFCRMRKISDNYTIISSRQYKRGSGIYKVKRTFHTATIQWPELKPYELHIYTYGN